MPTHGLRNTLILFFVASAVLPQACSSDGESPAGASGSAGKGGRGGTGFSDAASGTGGVSGSSGKGGTAGTGGAGATGGTGGSGGSAGDGGPAPVKCGSETCKGVTTPQGTSLAPCCSTNTRCGLEFDMPTAS